MSATGSVNLIVLLLLEPPVRPGVPGNLRRLVYFILALVIVPVYHDDFETPGISPRSASCRKHKRQMPNLRR
jgi:hypothetical protein